MREEVLARGPAGGGGAGDGHVVEDTGRRRDRAGRHLENRDGGEGEGSQGLHGICAGCREKSDRVRYGESYGRLTSGDALRVTKV